MIAVLDASVAIKWFAPDGNRDDAIAESVLREVASHPRRFVVPELFMYELMNVLCRRLRQARDVTAAIARIERLGMPRLRLDERLVQRTARLAFDRKLTGYDAAYASIAVVVGGTWLTFDRAAYKRVEPLGICAIPTLPRVKR